MNTLNCTPNHLAIIPDGNRRWAKRHGIKSEKEIYERGTEKIPEILEVAFQQGITCLTIWASSYANIIERPQALVSAMEWIYVRKFQELVSHPTVIAEDILVDARGEWKNLLKRKTVSAIERAIESTKGHSKKRLTILVGYDGKRERGVALQSLIRACGDAKEVLPDDIISTDNLLRNYSWTGHLPDVDLVVRTGSFDDPHNSAGFLSLLSGESQLAFPNVLWPDFSGEILTKILDDFSKRERRLGR